MGNLYKILPLALAFTFMLGACTVPAADQTAKVGTSGQQQNQAGDGQNVAAPTMRYAQSLNCGMLKDQNNKNNCESQLNDLVGAMLESEIYMNFDVARCKDLGGQMATVCEERINETGVKGPVSADEQTLFNEVMRGTPTDDPAAFGGVTYDSKKCEGLKTQGFSAYCVKMIDARLEQMKLEEVLSAGDAKRCDELKSEGKINECKMFFGVEVTPPVVDEPVVTNPAETEEQPVATEETAVLEITEGEPAAVEGGTVEPETSTEPAAEPATDNGPTPIIEPAAETPSA